MSSPITVAVSAKPWPPVLLMSHLSQEVIPKVVLTQDICVTNNGNKLKTEPCNNGHFSVGVSTVQ